MAANCAADGVRYTDDGHVDSIVAVVVVAHSSAAAAAPDIWAVGNLPAEASAVAWAAASNYWAVEPLQEAWHTGLRQEAFGAAIITE